jgi:hypothetical protein
VRAAESQPAAVPGIPGEPMAAAPLAPSLLAALERITVSAGCRGGSVGGRVIQAGSAAELTPRLSRTIYDVLHAGRPAEPAEPAGDTGSRKDAGFEARLLAATPHKSVVRTARLLSADAGQVRVELDGVKVVIPRGLADLSETGHSRHGDRVAVRLPSWRPALSPGYWVADGATALAAGEDILRVYVHLRTAAAAIAAWQTVLSLLAERGVAFRAKVASAPGLLPRNDALVVYLGGSAPQGGGLATASAVADRVGRIGGVGAGVSVFAERIAPGVAIGWEPADRRPWMRGLSFGEHRARAVAEGLVRHAAAPRGGQAAGAVRLALIEAGIDPARPARNLRQQRS